MKCTSAAQHGLFARRRSDGMHESGDAVPQQNDSHHGAAPMHDGQSQLSQQQNGLPKSKVEAMKRLAARRHEPTYGSASNIFTTPRKRGLSSGPMFLGTMARGENSFHVVGAVLSSWHTLISLVFINVSMRGEACYG